MAEVRVSKALSWALRHGAQSLGLHMRPDGFVSLSELLTKERFNQVTVDQVRHIVETSDKQRFALLEEDSGLYIRANQGHSVPGLSEEQLYTRIASPADLPVCVHGTYKRAWSGIVSGGGLLPMKRTHVHFAAGLPTATWHMPNPHAAAAAAAAGPVISGIRSTCELLIYADVAAAMAQGIAFYRSANGVILVDSLPVAFFLRVEDLTQGGALLFLNGNP
eukprot:17921-Heterococcus_DN1.PRE.1